MSCRSTGKKFVDSVVQCGLIAFDGQAIVARAIDDRFGDGHLAAYRIDRHRRTADFNQFQQGGKSFTQTLSQN